MSPELLWTKVLSHLETEISPAFYKAFIARTKAIKQDRNTLEVECPSFSAKEQLENKYQSLVKDALQKVSVETITLKLVVGESHRKGTKPAPLLMEIEKAKTKTGSSLTSSFSSNLSTQYTFDSFVIGPNNRLAVAVAKAITENPGTAYNPFFLYSGVGLGKTHLIQAIGNEILKSRQNARVIYLTGESFTNELVEAIQNSKKQYNAVAKFREKYRNVDTLIIDDVQFIAGRETTQEEFFHTFNALYLNKKQVIVSSDRPPKDIARLEERLSSRFLSGMTADMQAPDLDMRVAIVRQKRDLLNLPLNNEVVDFVAERVISNVRELEGTLLQVAARAKALNNPALTINEIAAFLGQATLEKTKQYATGDIIKAVATYYSVKTIDLKGPRRLKEVVWPRQIAMYLLRTMTGTPLVTVGQLFGGRDHSTVLHSTDKIEAAIKTNSKLNQDIANIKQTLD